MTSQAVQKQLADLEKMTTGDLRAQYRDLFGDEARSWNRQWLFRRCAWRVQALAEGGLPERARQRAMRAALSVERGRGRNIFRPSARWWN